MSALRIGYYPGCSGQGTSMEYDSSTRAVCAALDITLDELPDWSCCGSTPAHATDHVLSAALAARNFAQAETAGIRDVITPCPSCLKNLHNCLRHMEDDPLFAARVDALTERPLQGPHSIKSVLQVIVENVGLEAVKARVRRPLKGLKVVPYYGCLMTRPADSMKFDNPENPVSMDRLLEALGAEVLPYPLKVECCGAAFGIPKREAVNRLSGKLLDLAVELGADAIVTACPLCQMNLDLRQGQINRANGTKHRLPAPYFTQLMGYAFGLPDSEIAFGKLAVNVEPAFVCMGRRAAEIEAAEAAARAKEAEKARAAAEKAAKAAAKALEQKAAEDKRAAAETATAGTTAAGGEA